MAIPELNYRQPKTSHHSTDMHSALFRTLAASLLGALLVPMLHASPDQDRRTVSFEVKPILKGLRRPTGIALYGNHEVYFSEVPNPGMANAGNSVSVYDLEDCDLTVLHTGEPEPTNLALDRHGNLYWTCKSAGVILEQDCAGNTAPVLTGLAKPSGISLDRWGRIYFTQIPTPGTPGTAGGKNSVDVFDDEKITNLTTGEPEPTDIVSSRTGTLYWTCRTAGVILRRTEDGKVAPLLTGLPRPTGIALNAKGNLLYWTEVPTPGKPGSQGGENKVWELNLHTMQRTLVNAGDPEPTDVAVSRDGDVYWTCTSAGVIVEAKRKVKRN
jgi:hypothetical protein